MAKERTWIDYANLGSNIAQNLQLRHTNQTLEELQRTATVSALNEQEKRQAEEHEARLREHVFQLADNVEGLQRHLHELPCAALALGIQMKGMLEKNNVTTVSFRAWEDKDRLKKVVNGLDDVCEKSASQLTEGQREDAEKCAKYLAEKDALDQLISVQSEKEKFQRERENLERRLDLDGKRVEMEKLKSEKSRFCFPTWERPCFAVGGLALFISTIFFGLWKILLNSADSPEENLPIPSGLVWPVFMISLVMTIVPLFTPAHARYAELTKKITALDAEIARAKVELKRFDSKAPILPKPLEAMPGLERDVHKEVEELIRSKDGLLPKYVTQDRLQELYVMFGGDLTSEAYEKMQQEREAFINKIFGKSDTTAIAS